MKASGQPHAPAYLPREEDAMTTIEWGQENPKTCPYA
jgi:hypothetical protein